MFLTKECPDQFDGKVKCEACKCWLDKDDAERVKVVNGWEHEVFYCRSDKPPYDEKHYTFAPRTLSDLNDNNIKYFGLRLVNEDGTLRVEPKKSKS